MIWTPFLIADLYQRLQVGPNNTKESAGQGAPSSLKTSEGASGEMKIYTERVQASCQGLQALTRQEVLARSNEWFRIYLEWMQNLELVKEETIELYSKYRPDHRTQRIELSRKVTELRQKWNEAENKLQYMLAKRRRMQELMEDDGDALEEQGGEEEETLRERALARLEWSIYNSCQQLQMSVRELEMLQGIQPEQREAISKEYQQTLDAVRRGELSLGRHTYTILPDGSMMAGTLSKPQGLDPNVVLQGGGQMPTSLLNQHMFRQQVQDELMVDRNPTTMTLQEFAMKEMTEVQRQMDEVQTLQQQQQEEDERLGEEGIEERQRVKDSKWADWQDDHPAYGITNKGNYS
ncbi:hypothetical protein AGDE_01688 [Angomonas deanei]|nr:hypothetical protein AGDE_01688 [Angomonas deanei]|eukprot:EPY42235.1 hypothetical protein AGDE_01688 [Angomonas deanei]